MRQDNKLNKALKNAFEGHMEPLRDEQWSRLTVELGGKKTKKRVLPWFFLSVVLAISCLGIGYWIGKGWHGQTGHQPATEVYRGPETGGSPGTEDAYAAGKNGAESSEGRHNSSGGNGPQMHDQASSTQAGHSANDRNKRPGQNRWNASRSETDATEDGEEYGTGRHTGTDPDHEVEGIYELPEGFEPELTLMHMPIRKFNAGAIKEDDIQAGLTGKLREERKKDWPKLGPVHYNRLAIGFSTGISPVKFSIAEIEHPEKVHKDLPQLFETATGRSSSFFGNLNIDIGISENFPLSISTGLQYRRISQEVDMDYTRKEIPWREPDGRIIGYFRDTTGKVKIQHSGTNYLNFVHMPLKLAYTLTPGLRKKNEFQISGGLNFSFLAASRGKTFDLTEYKTVSLKDNIRSALNSGWSAGLRYNRHVYRSWWLGLEAQRQQNILKYDVGYGLLKSKVTISNYNLHLQYKF